MKKAVVLIPAVLILASGCSRTNDYTPPAGAGGEAIFQGACMECHSGGFELSPETANVDAISAKVNSGSLAMPAFPNIQGESMASLAEYVLTTQTKGK